MIVERMEITHFKDITHFATDFDPRLALIPEKFSESIHAALYILLGKTLKTRGIRSGTNLSAKFRIHEKIYSVSVTPKAAEKQEHTTVFCEGKKLSSKDFYESLQQSPEEDRLNRFDANPKTFYSDRLKLYKDPVRYFGKETFSEMTDGIGLTTAFRMCLKNYIKHYEPQNFWDIDPLYMILRNDGVFEIKSPTSPEKIVSLSPDARLWFEFLCFININRFWNEVEEIRDLNHIGKPLFIKGFSPQNESFFTARPYPETADRQLFLLSCRADSYF